MFFVFRAFHNILQSEHELKKVKPRQSYRSRYRQRDNQQQQFYLIQMVRKHGFLWNPQFQANKRYKIIAERNPLHQYPIYAQTENKDKESLAFLIEEA